MADLSVTVAGLPLKNPIVAGSGEATMTMEGLRAAVDAGAGAVVAKSTNESQRARRQLEVAEYLLLDPEWRVLPWGHAPRSASLLCRSGLVGEPFDRWLEILTAADAYAADQDAYVVASLIVADLEEAKRSARQIERAGLRWLELNVGPPYRGEAPVDAIRSEVEAAGVTEVVDAVRREVDLPLTVKLSGHGDPLDAAAAARRAGADAVCLAGRFAAFLPDLATRRPHLGTYGAIGGAWALPVTLRWVAKARSALGPTYPLIGTNGARDGYDVARFMLAGASAVQLTSAVITEGPTVLTRAVGELDGYMDEQGVTAAQLIGEAADNVQSFVQIMEEEHR